ncbi:MAG TPA: sigma-70 family RNA polymerase sigma factor [Chitinophagaceae bacterium]|nr:sigma-70 family RNA polymerase sigma factor [Chitinophagaceae bacterium]HNA91268.1 sigma-70 family RNA polymerase sigma factor [Chitinophagaceae bacterium]HNC39384.1 sigma-70 family RNA polymerase sigma factor [Chitinophagaceae bacterium]HNF38032.1 sigma-70 family RNA polymerase sigma factor [Chitinophagaceae bacterium]HNK60292.1 sigma-70 family RNA polymerase sigma factor [Chitinophagaceae bacterium]
MLYTKLDTIKWLPNESFSEQELIERILDGEKKLYEIIVRRFNPYLYKIGRSYNFSHEDTEDLMQDSFVDAYKNLSQFEARSGFKTWLIRIMLNNCFRKKSKSSFKNETMKEITDSDRPLYAQSGEDTANLVSRRELNSIIETAMAQLPHEYRMVFSLREINGCSVAETAELLNISEANVKVRLNRTKTMLRNNIENDFIGENIFEFNLVYCSAMVNRVMNEIKNLP